jgi:hypothetical protein
MLIDSWFPGPKLEERKVDASEKRKGLDLESERLIMLNLESEKA